MMENFRTIMHIDMDAFFASVEQVCNPGLRGKPVAVIGSAGRTVVTTASYEARRYGVKTGMNKYEAKRICPSLTLVVGNNRKYVDVSIRILAILKEFSPQVEVYSIDEAFIDLTGLHRVYGSPLNIAQGIKKRINKEIGITCSIGIGPNKLLAKLASGMDKPDGLVVITEADRERILEGIPVDALWGIGPRLATYLNEMGIHTCGELGRYPVSLLRKRFGIVGERLSLMGRGIDHSPVIPVGEEAESRSIGHSMTLPRDVYGADTLKRYILQLSDMVGRRARRYQLKGRKIHLTIRYADFYTFCRQKTISIPTSNTHIIYANALKILGSIRLTRGVRLVGVGISDLLKGDSQIPLFEEERVRERLLEATDLVRDHFGESALLWGTLVEKDAEPDVIPPSWRPEGVRRV